jgi:hypothetical protein
MGTDRGAQGDALPAYCAGAYRACASTSICRILATWVFRYACKMCLEGIVSKPLGSRYVSGRSKDWLKFKNPGRRRL